MLVLTYIEFAKVLSLIDRGLRGGSFTLNVVGGYIEIIIGLSHGIPTCCNICGKMVGN